MAPSQFHQRSVIFRWGMATYALKETGDERHGAIGASAQMDTPSRQSPHEGGCEAKRTLLPMI